MVQSDSEVVGVVLLIRHGDRQGFYQDPTTYTPSNTILTPLGNQQEYQLGQQLRQLYLNSSSSSYINGMNGTFVNNTQFCVRADAGGEGGVILNSAQSLLQGLIPANPNFTITLANGSTIGAPLNGYQYLPIESVEPTNDVSLEGWTSCHTFDKSTSAFYNSTEFKDKASEYKVFLDSLPPLLNGRSVDLQNMWNIYDFMNVESIHNSDFAKNLPPGSLQTARYLADWHEYNVFSDPQVDGIGNIAGQTIIPSIIDGFNSILSPTDPVKFVYLAVSYKPFLSLFNMTKAAEASPQLAAIVNYAAVLALEVRQPKSGEPVVRFQFSNGTGTDDYKAYPILGSASDVLLSDFISYLQPVGIESINKWCSVCANTQDRGCGALNLAVAESHPTISPVGAGFLGAGLALAVAMAMFAVLFFMGCLTVAGKFKSKRSTKSSIADSEEKV